MVMVNYFRSKLHSSFDGKLFKNKAGTNVVMITVNYLRSN